PPEEGLVYGLWDYTAQQSDELSFSEGDAITVLRRRDDTETEWWWARLNEREGYVPRNLLGVRQHKTQQFMYLFICMHKFKLFYL
uniref:SH3 domain-containing protein n=1 Tax=Periophthalmus magnuspinnatus TaxID=409849 RepID=A0A3B3ZZF1_9GOBI